MGSMSEARVRFLTAVKAHYTARYHQGWLSSMGLRVLKVGYFRGMVGRSWFSRLSCPVLLTGVPCFFVFCRGWFRRGFCSLTYDFDRKAGLDCDRAQAWFVGFADVDDVLVGSSRKAVVRIIVSLFSSRCSICGCDGAK